MAGLSTAKQYTRVRVPAYAPQKILLEKRKFKVFVIFTVHCQKRGNYWNTQLNSTSIRMKQLFYDFVQSFGEKIELKSKTLFKRLK